MKKLVIIMAMAMVFGIIGFGCGPSSHMVVNGRNLETESVSTISGDASDVARENRDAKRDLALAELYKKLAAAQTPEEQDELLKAIAVMEGKTNVPFFRNLPISSTPPASGTGLTAEEKMNIIRSSAERRKKIANMRK